MSMKKASIVSIGNELLNGHTIDTNAAYMEGRLFSIGIPVVSVHTIGDDEEEIVRTLSLASKDGDIIIVTGGLGPTDDDVTRQGFAKFLGVELRLKEGLAIKIKEFFAIRGLNMPERNIIQAYIPAGARAIENKFGTAPGIMAEKDGKIFFLMPGVPMEMKQMFEDCVLPELEKTFGQAIAIKKLKCFGMGGSAIAEQMGSLMQRGRNPLINCTVGEGIITLHIIATAEEKELAERMIEEDEKLLRNLIGELIYGTGEENLVDVVGRKLAERKKTIATAESCTGGLLAKLLTDVPGSSEYFLYGWVTYSNRAKTTELGVPGELIEKFGAVSEKTAEAMAKGAKERAKTDFAISITGIAGPTGGSKEKPVGLVYIGIASDKTCEVKRFVFSGDRGFIRLRAALTALNLLRLEL